LMSGDGLVLMSAKALMVSRDRGHANCLENLPVFAVIVLCAAALGKPAAVEVLAQFVLYARIGQTAAHLWGTGPLQVLVRACF